MGTKTADTLALLNASPDYVEYRQVCVDLSEGRVTGADFDAAALERLAKGRGSLDEPSALGHAVADRLRTRDLAAQRPVYDSRGIGKYWAAVHRGDLQRPNTRRQ